MASKNKVLWESGLFVQPQHCQQQQRYIDFVTNSRFEYQLPFCYGFHSLEIDTASLKVGRVRLNKACGVFKDGTLFTVPEQDLQPDALDLDGREQTVYLAIPLGSDYQSEIDSALLSMDGKRKEKHHIYRYTSLTEKVHDLHTRQGGEQDIALAQLQPRLITDSDDHGPYVTLPFCRVKSKTTSGELLLDAEFIPTCSCVTASRVLASYASELAQTIESRASQLALRIGSPDQQGIADVAEFMMLQLLNRASPLFHHFTDQTTLHPALFYRDLVQLCGELMTFTAQERLPDAIPPYRHDDLTATFQPLIKKMRKALGTVLTPRAISIPLEPHGHGVKITGILEQNLLDSANFILAVKASMPQEQLRQKVIQQFKVTSADRIRDLVSVQVPGVPLTALSAAPRQLPYHVGFTYFSLDTQSEAWDTVLKERNVAIHVSGEFPELIMQFWAVRGNG